MSDEAIELQAFKCLACQNTLADTDGRFLYINGVKFIGACGGGQSVRCLCNCGRFRIWHPIERIAKARQIMYNAK